MKRSRGTAAALLALGAVLAVRVVTAQAPTFEGAWSSDKDFVRFTPTATADVFAISGTLAKDIKLSQSARLAQDTIELDARLAETGFVDALVDKIEKKTVHVKFVLGRDATGDLIQASFRTSDGVTGQSTLRRLGTGWRELPMAGSYDAEEKLFADLRKQIVELQDSIAKGGAVERGFHNKGFGLRAELRVRQDIPRDLQVGLFQPGALYPAIVRFSNAAAKNQSDACLDQRGLAIRVKTGRVAALLSGASADAQDFLTTNSPITARDPVQFLAFARAQLEPTRLLSVVKRYGALEAGHITAVLLRGEDKTPSVADESLWSSRAPIKWGQYAVKFQLTPEPGYGGSGIAFFGKDHLHDELAKRLARGDLRLDFSVQRFRDEKTTPIEDGSVEWTTPVEKVGELVIPQQDLDGADARALAAEIERLAFNPWNATDDFRPLGRLMRARRTVYQTSAQHRGACPFGFLGK